MDRLPAPGDAPPITTETGFTINTPYGLETVARADTVIVPPCQPTSRWCAWLWRSGQLSAGEPGSCPVHRGLCAGRSRSARRPSGYDALAACGRVHRQVPNVKLELAVLYVDDGNVLTSAGTAAANDLCCTSCGRTLVLTRRTPSPAAWSSRLIVTGAAVRRTAAPGHGQRGSVRRDPGLGTGPPWRGAHSRGSRQEVGDELADLRSAVSGNTAHRLTDGCSCRGSL